MTYLQLKKRIAWITGLGTSGDDSSEDWIQLGDIVNEAVIDILSRTRINMRCVDITLTSNQREYELAQTILQMYGLLHGSTVMQEVSPGDIDRVGTGHFAIIGFNRLALGWDPDDDLVLEAWYSPKPTVMTADAHDPSTVTYGNIPVQFHDAIINFACWKITDATGDQASGRGEKYRISYEGKDGLGSLGSDLGRIKTQINRRGITGSRRQRIARDGELITGDLTPDAWVG